MAFAWRRLDARLSDEARSLAFIKPGSSVLPLILMTAPSKDHPENHFMCLAVIERGAYVPILFADQDQQPLRLTGETVLTSSDALLSYNPLTNDGRFMLPNPHEAASYDYLWIYNPVLAKLDLPPEWSRIFESEWVTLWQRHVSKGAAPGGS